MSYFALVRQKLEYTLVICNSITSTDSSKMKGTQRKFAALRTYNNALQLLQHYNLHDMQFFINV
jgi:hypothetical protein